MIHSLRVAVLAWLLGASACETATSIPVFVIDSVDVASDEVVGTLDVSRSYQYRLSMVVPDSVLTDLWLSAIPVDRAWLPLDDFCASPLGARFTIMLKEPDARMGQHDFDSGTGELACATMLREYRIVEPKAFGQP